MNLPIDLDRAGPERLLDESDPGALAAAVEAIDAWTPRRLSLVDDVLTGWVAEFIARPHDREGLIALQSAIERVLHARSSRAESMHEDDQHASTYARRWKAFSDAIEARDITLAERDPNRVRGLRHVADIETMLQSRGEVSQREVQEQLELSPSRLSQVLALMESHGLIVRRTAGRERFVARAASSLPVAVSVSTSNTWRGLDYLVGRTA